MTESGLHDFVVAARTRWKSENENNNVLKNYGYHLEHNFGHGQQYLALVLVMLNLLAFLFHTTLDPRDEAYRLVRIELAARQTFFHDVQALTRDRRSTAGGDAHRLHVHPVLTLLTHSSPPARKRAKRR